MATRTQSRPSNRSTSSSAKRSRSSASASRSSGSASRSSSSESRSAFSWGDNAGPLIGAALAGVALGFAANFGRKAMMQGMAAAAGDWDEILAAEHDATLALFDKMLATDETQTFKRKMLLTKLCYSLDKHAYEEEMVIYPALRQANETVDAEHLEHEHGSVKTFLYELGQMPADAPNWLEKVREFRELISSHARMEEEQVFPRFKDELTDKQNARITDMVNRDGFWMA
jgi:hemerythrin superfamily protein